MLWPIPFVAMLARPNWSPRLVPARHAAVCSVFFGRSVVRTTKRAVARILIPICLPVGCHGNGLALRTAILRLATAIRTLPLKRPIADLAVILFYY